MTPIPEPDVRAELDRILASKGFATAGRLSKLLRYVVEKTLAGETDQLKEYAVGIEVFERDEKYDPRLDSIVRVEAGRLRTRLDEYYNGDGSSSPIRISAAAGRILRAYSPRRRAATRRPRLNTIAAAPATSTIAGGDSARGRIAVRDRRDGRSGSAAGIAIRGPDLTADRGGAAIRSQHDWRRKQQLHRD